MEMITKKSVFALLGANDLILLKCSYCSKSYKAQKKWIVHALKYKTGGYKYCSRNCFAKSRKKSIACKCLNCSKKIKRKPSAIYANNNGNVFCSHRCSAIYSNSHRTHSIETKNKLRDLASKRKQKIVFINKKCPSCNIKFKVRLTKKAQIYCSGKCVKSSVVWREKMGVIQQERCSGVEERKRLRDIGRKGGFGEKGKTQGGVLYQSRLEKECFEYLENCKVVFEPHKFLPNSSKVSDLFIPEIDLWIELDGIDREKRKKWIGKDYGYWMDKIAQYKAGGLNCKVFKRKQDFIDFIRMESGLIGVESCV